MYIGSGVSTYDLSSMEKYGETRITDTDAITTTSQSEVVGLQSMFRFHRAEVN